MSDLISLIGLNSFIELNSLWVISNLSIDFPNNIFSKEIILLATSLQEPIEIAIEFILFSRISNLHAAIAIDIIRYFLAPIFTKSEIPFSSFLGIKIEVKISLSTNSVFLDPKIKLLIGRTLFLPKDFNSNLMHEFINNKVLIYAEDELSNYITNDLFTKLRHEDYHNEYLDMKLNIKIVSDIKQAINHIEEYGSLHTESIVTSNERNKEIFIQRIVLKIFSPNDFI